MLRTRAAPWGPGVWVVRASQREGGEVRMGGGLSADPTALRKPCEGQAGAEGHPKAPFISAYAPAS